MQTRNTAVTAALLVFSGAAGAAPDAYRDLVVADSPILWYRMGAPDGSASIPNEGSLGAAHDAGIFGGVTLGEPSAAGDTAASFAYGTTPYLESASPVPLSMTGNPTFTAEAVVYIPSVGTTTNYPPFLHWGDARTGREVYFSLHHHDKNRVYCGYYNGGLAADCTFRLDDWNHFVWVRDAAGGTNDAYTGSRLFVNGIEEDLTIDTVLIGFPGPPDVNAAAFRVQRARDLTRYFDGTIDEIVLYDTAHTPGQIAARFGALGINDPALCAADLDGNCGVLDLTDVNLFVAGFLSHDPIADLNSDGVYDLADVTLFIASFNAGCPD
jgi:hypothetical protein